MCPLIDFTGLSQAPLPWPQESTVSDYRGEGWGGEGETAAFTLSVPLGFVLKGPPSKLSSTLSILEPEGECTTPSFHRGGNGSPERAGSAFGVTL